MEATILHNTCSGSGLPRLDGLNVAQIKTNTSKNV